MISLTTAKLLLLVALCLGPKDKDLATTHTILITSNNDNCVWTQKAHGWNLDQKGLATHDWPANGMDLSTQDLRDLGPENSPKMRSIAHHDWKHHPVLILDNGDRVEKRGNKIFYTFRPGDPTQKVYTLLTVENGVPL